MHAQKTIAKWLAIILLVTIVVTSYILFDTFYSKKQNATSLNVAGANNKTETPSHTEKYYSTFPRNFETVDGLKVHHIGGEKDDLFLDCISFHNKKFVFFSSNSEQYDVNSSGIYCALFIDNALTKVFKVGILSETFMCATLTANGIAVITKSVEESIIRLYTTKGILFAKNKFDVYFSYKTVTNNNQISLFCTNADSINYYTFFNDLTYIKSTYTSSINIGSIIDAFPISNIETGLFVKSGKDVVPYVFNQNMGFLQRDVLVNNDFLQIVPCNFNDDTMFCALFSYENNILIKAYGESLKCRYTTTLENVATAYAMQEGKMLKIVSLTHVYHFCPHLDLLFKEQINTKTSHSKVGKFIHIYDNLEYAILKDDNSLSIVRCIDNDIVFLFTAKSIADKSFVSIGDNDIELITSFISDNAFGYMSFGGQDVYRIILSNNNSKNDIDS